MIAKYDVWRKRRKQRKQNSFQYFKLHVFTHWVIFIRLYDNAQNFDTSYKKAIHKFLLKQFFFKTNKIEEWNKQILMHNIRHHNLISMKDFIMYTKIKTTSIASQKFKKKITIYNRNLMNMLMTFNISDRARLFVMKENNRHWRKTDRVIMNNQFNCSELIDALTVYIWKNCKKLIET